MPFAWANHNGAGQSLDQVTANQERTFSARYFNTHEYTKLIKMKCLKDKIHP